MTQPNQDNVIEDDIEEAASVGVKSTPTFFLGTIDGDLPVVHVMRVVHGALPFEQFQQAIEDVIGSMSAGWFRHSRPPA